MPVGTIIFHVDLDCFFASVEARDLPEYKGKPLIVGADPKNGNGRGVISTCSYEARTFGLHSGMPISKAFRLCPHGTYLRPSFEKYKVASNQVMVILKNNAVKFQLAGLDEAFLDMSDRCTSFKHAVAIASSLQHKVKEIVGITCSIGIAPTKVLAKIASDMHKPNGITVIDPQNVIKMIGSLDITKIPGIGRKSREWYVKKGLETIGDVARHSLPQLSFLVGKRTARWLYSIIHAETISSIHHSRVRKSISKERTFSTDVDNISMVREKMDVLNHALHEIMREKGITYKNVSVKVRFEGFETFTRARTLQSPMLNEEKARDYIHELFKEFESKGKKFRLIGVKFSDLGRISGNGQQSILEFLTSHQVSRSRTGNGT